eukprot:scaffold4099_cov73-Skeletonema_dohrnii-CCMP3373.AAC.2
MLLAVPLATYCCPSQVLLSKAAAWQLLSTQRLRLVFIASSQSVLLKKRSNLLTKNHMMATPPNNVRRHSKLTTSNYCIFGSYSSDHEYGGGRQSFKLFVECFSSPPPISSTSSRLSSFSHRRALKGSSFHNRQHQQQTLNHVDSIKSSSVHLHEATSNSADVNSS